MNKLLVYDCASWSYNILRCIERHKPMFNALFRLVRKFFEYLENVGWATLEAHVEHDLERRDQADLLAQFARSTSEEKPSE